MIYFNVLCLYADNEQKIHMSFSVPICLRIMCSFTTEESKECLHNTDDHRYTKL